MQTDKEIPEDSFYICKVGKLGHIPMQVSSHGKYVGRVFIHLAPYSEGGFLTEINFLGEAWFAADSLKRVFNEIVSTRLPNSEDATLEKIAGILREHGFKQTETIT